ncbi:unnamed protein product [Somion occarium]|uniref:DUF6533 domain-containing protein n=1 Tax=Somion occarium TaxID=3059160 RepID=A0ABP1DT90_9APHY
MSALDIPLSESLETAIRHGVAVQAMTLAGFTILLYDHILTLSQEVDTIWRSPSLGLVSIIFLLNRYIVPLMLIVDIYEFFGVADDSEMFCKVWTCLQSFLTVASFMSIHVIVALRIYALYNGRRWIGRLLWTSGTIYLLSSASIITIAQVQLIPDLKPIHHACVGAIPSYLWAAWLPSVIFESLFFGLTLYAMFDSDRRHSLNTLSLILYRDGMLYFIVVAFCSLFSLLVWAIADPTLLGLARYFALAVVNLAGSRMVLNLKSYAASKDPSTVNWGSLGPSLHTSVPAHSSARQEVEGDGHSSGSTDPPFDLELYSIERESQQLGTRLMHR